MSQSYSQLGQDKWVLNKFPIKNGYFVDVNMDNYLSIVNNIPVLKSNKFYRMGNLLYKLGNRWKEDRSTIITSSDFDNSILKEYLLSCKDPLNDDFQQSLLKKVALQNKLKYFVDQDETVFLSVRAGDIVLDEKGKLLSKNCYAIKYSTNIIDHNRIILEIKKILDKKCIKQIKIISCLHFGDNEKSNRWIYSEESEIANKKLLSDLFYKIDKSFNIKIYNNKIIENYIQGVDNDFINLVFNKNVILDGGAFAKLIRSLRRIVQASNKH